jgi:hypothetical protein
MHQPALRPLTDERFYERVESIILDLQLSISSVTRANACLDLDTVRQIRAHASQTLGNIDETLAHAHVDPWQAERVAQRRKVLSQALREPAPIEQLARVLHVG